MSHVYSWDVYSWDRLLCGGTRSTVSLSCRGRILFLAARRGEPERPASHCRDRPRVSMSSALRRKHVIHAAQMLIASLTAILSRTRRSEPSSPFSSPIETTQFLFLIRARHGRPQAHFHPV